LKLVGAHESDIGRRFLGGPGTLSRRSCTGDQTGIFSLGHYRVAFRKREFGDKLLYSKEGTCGEVMTSGVRGWGRGD